MPGSRSDVFVSYAREDQAAASCLVDFFCRLGLDVFWDQDIRPGEQFDARIEHELERAAHVVVLWSSHSFASEWVRAEAAFAQENECLIPVTIEPVALPLAFRLRQYVDLTEWRGEPDNSELHRLVAFIEAGRQAM